VFSGHSLVIIFFKLLFYITTTAATTTTIRIKVKSWPMSLVILGRDLNIQSQGLDL